MHVIKAQRTVYFDVDDTLLIANYGCYYPSPEEVVSVKCPDSGYTTCFMKHERHINLMKQFKARGHTIIVWSQGGHRWAESAVKLLELDSIVDYCMDKPSWYVDDLPSTAFMGRNVYLHPTDPSKDNKHYPSNEELDEKTEGEDCVAGR